jgi:hypothetical protein
MTKRPSLAQARAGTASNEAIALWLRNGTQMNQFLSRLMPDVHPEWVVLGFHLAITVIVFALLGMQLVPK